MMMESPEQNTTTTAPVSGKRRAAEERCAAMVHHARAQIMAVGVNGLSVNEVLRLSGGSKATLVKYFGDKTGLIAAAIGEEAREAMAGLALEGRDDLPFERALASLLEGVLGFYLQPGALALYRAVIASAESDRNGARAFYDHGHGVVVDAVAAFLLAPTGGDLPHARSVADSLLHVIRAGIYERALLGLEPLPVPDVAIAAHVRQALALVLPGILAVRSD